MNGIINPENQVVSHDNPINMSNSEEISDGTRRLDENIQPNIEVKDHSVCSLKMIEKITRLINFSN
jgi:hypothetical protein